MIKPNPFNHQAEIVFSSHMGPISLGIYNALGLKVFEENTSGLSDHFKLKIDTRQFESEIYILNLQGSNLNIARKLIKN